MLPGFVFCVCCVTSISCLQKSIRHGNKDALYERGISIGYHGHIVIKLHVFSRTNASREIWNKIQRHLREWYISHMVFQQTERKEKHDTDRGQQTKNLSLH